MMHRHVGDLVVAASPHAGEVGVRLPLGYDPLRSREIVIGRDSRADVVVDDEAVSRRHAKVLVEGNNLRVVDLASNNGTFLNGRRVAAEQLKVGDQICIGSTVLRLFDNDRHTPLLAWSSGAATACLYLRLEVAKDSDNGAADCESLMRS
ncbi:MAG: FHA domain-containing protein [Archangiaceae bacterium]|nr:FHA domain-containing protein [Archangiaceae bacterium]